MTEIDLGLPKKITPAEWAKEHEKLALDWLEKEGYSNWHKAHYAISRMAASADKWMEAAMILFNLMNEEGS